MTEAPPTAPSRRRWLKRAALRVLVLVILVWLVLTASLYFRQNDLLFMPRAEIARTPEDIGLRFEDKRVRTEDGESLAAWWIPHPQPRCSVIHFHGNAGNRSGRLADARRFHRLGCNVLMTDYRGYGGSSGSPSEAGTYLDAEAMWDAALESGADPASTVVFGRSLGGPHAAYLASRRPAGGLILESTFESLPTLADDLFGWLSVHALVRNEYPTAKYLAAFEGPVLILHSPEDDLIPFAHGRRLADERGATARLVELAGDHNHGPSATGAPYVAALSEFVDRVVHGR
ncbi:MAG: alpha/beta hydrolase [Nannocystales bacterium]